MIARRRRVFRTFGWLTPTARRRIALADASWESRDPLRWDAALRSWWWRIRVLQCNRAGKRVLGGPTTRSFSNRDVSAPARLAFRWATPDDPAARVELTLDPAGDTVLEHLTALADAGLLDRERSGREVRYRVTPEPLSDAVSWMAAVGGQ